MRKYLLLILAFIVVVYSQNCQQVGSSSIATFTSCKITAPPPQLNWIISVTLLQNYQWRGADQVKYLYQTQNGLQITQKCYQGQTIKGNYMKDTKLVVEHLCLNFTPSISRGDKVYMMLFWDRASTQKLIIYLSFNSNGQLQMNELPQDKHSQIITKMNNLISQ